MLIDVMVSCWVPSPHLEPSRVFSYRVSSSIRTAELSHNQADEMVTVTPLRHQPLCLWIITAEWQTQGFNEIQGCFLWLSKVSCHLASHPLRVQVTLSNCGAEWSDQQWQDPSSLVPAVLDLLYIFIQGGGEASDSKIFNFFLCVCTFMWLFYSCGQFFCLRKFLLKKPLFLVGSALWGVWWYWLCL